MKNVLLIGDDYAALDYLRISENIREIQSRDAIDCNVLFEKDEWGSDPKLVLDKMKTDDNIRFYYFPQIPGENEWNQGAQNKYDLRYCVDKLLNEHLEEEQKIDAIIIPRCTINDRVGERMTNFLDDMKEKFPDSQVIVQDFSGLYFESGKTDSSWACPLDEKSENRHGQLILRRDEEGKIVASDGTNYHMAPEIDYAVKGSGIDRNINYGILREALGTGPKVELEAEIEDDRNPANPFHTSGTTAAKDSCAKF